MTTTYRKTTRRYRGATVREMACHACGIVKTLDELCRDNRSTTGRRALCKACDAARK